MSTQEKDCDELHGWYSPTQFNKNNVHNIELLKYLYYVNVDNNVVEVTMVSNTTNHNTYFKDMQYVGKLKRFYKQIYKQFTMDMKEYRE